MFPQLMWWHSEHFHPVQDLTKCTEQSSMQSSCFCNTALNSRQPSGLCRVIQWRVHSLTSPVLSYWLKGRTEKTINKIWVKKYLFKKVQIVFIKCLGPPLVAGINILFCWWRSYESFVWEIFFHSKVFKLLSIKECSISIWFAVTLRAMHK